MTITVAMTAPAPAPSQVITRFGNTYVPDSFGNVTALQPDVLDLLAAGFTVVPVSGSLRLAKLLGANMNVTTDQALGMLIPANWKFRITKVTVENASISLTTAAGGFYPAVSKGGTAFVAAAQAYSTLTTALLALDCTVVAGTLPTVYAAGTLLYFSLTTGQGAAATADIQVYGDVYTS